MEGEMKKISKKEMETIRRAAAVDALTQLNEYDRCVIDSEATNLELNLRNRNRKVRFSRGAALEVLAALGKYFNEHPERIRDV